MTSKEALENLVHCKSETKCKECKHKYRCTMERDYNTIKQDLKRKEVLEKENEELKYKLFKMQPLEEENRRMFGEIQKIQKELGTEKWKSIQFLEDFKKLKIVIEILKNKNVDIFFLRNNCEFVLDNYNYELEDDIMKYCYKDCLLLTQQECDLLKEEFDE